MEKIDLKKVNVDKKKEIESKILKKGTLPQVVCKDILELHINTMIKINETINKIQLKFDKDISGDLQKDRDVKSGEKEIIS